MNLATRYVYSDYNFPIWASVCSVLLHLLLAVFIPKLQFEKAPEQPPPLIIKFVHKPESMPAVALPEPISPAVEPLPEFIKPTHIPQTVTQSVAETEPKLIKEEPKVTKATPSDPELVAAASKPDIESQQVIVQSPPTPAVPTQTEIEDANRNYGDSLWGAIERHKNYPRIAQQRGWQGETLVELLLDGDGKLRSKRILHSSGYQSLDNQALEMVEKALPFPRPPEALRTGNFIILVPIPFKLDL